MRHLTYLLFLISIYSCKSQKDTPAVVIEDSLHITLMDSTSAAKQIVTDRYDSFFESLSFVDMAIQLRSEKRYSSKNEALIAYKKRLQDEVSNWSNAEKEVMLTTMKNVKRMLDNINPELWPNNIDLIKIKTNHYGPDVYYTREDAILIPGNVFSSQKAKADLEQVMLHEIYHILSRYNDSFRKETYQLIDFYPHGKKVVISEALQTKRLSNPDGITLDFAIRLSDGKGNEVLGTPFLKSSQPFFSKQIPSFFAYISFDMFQFEEKEDGSIYLVSDKAANTTLAPDFQSDYFNHISDNTQYVIHPEEVMADNFKLATISNDTGDFSDFSVSGKKLIDETLEAMKAFKK